jgi:hypothetical protein
MSVQQIKEVVSACFQLMFCQPGLKQVQQLAGADAWQGCSYLQHQLQDDFLFKQLVVSSPLSVVPGMSGLAKQLA